MQENVRYPAVAGRFYPLERDALRYTIEQCFEHRLGPRGPLTDIDDPEGIVSILAPHAGYMASGMIAAHSYAALMRRERPDAYVVIGPDHHGIPYASALCSDPYLTPLGRCDTHKKICSKLSEYIPDDARAHGREHSIEVQIPFIQTVDPDAKIVPVIMSRQDLRSARTLADALKGACEGHDVIYIASSDLMHYVPATVEKRMDAAYLEHVVACDVESMYGDVMGNDMTVCGNGPTAVAILASGAERGRLLSHGNSWDSLAHDESAVVGYGSVAFW